ncbi:DUF1494 domain-containing protein [Candidatus Clavichlamydia salmonicola]|uniref:DUF1494 domain-containing protein n=1 Tax=Candidatus Clavichlamydia salmonicola TaxID=469812 RepID=UPI001890EEB9|nr:DUF1494 domain-containing protein [Candidatus Clavichlamydia salmonicola]
MKKKLKKQSVLLSEMLVTFFLFSLLFSSLTFWFHRHQRSQKGLEASYRTIAEEHSAFLRLRNIFDKITVPEMISVQATELYFIFNRGASLLSLPQGIVSARFFLEEAKGRFMLGIKGSESLTPQEEKVFPFLDDVVRCEWKPIMIKSSIEDEGGDTIGEPPVALELLITRKAAHGLPERVLRYMFEINACPLMS